MASFEVVWCLLDEGDQERRDGDHSDNECDV